MTGLAVLASVILAQAPIVAATHQPVEPAEVDVAYSELAAGMPAAAEARIEANRALDAQDPARLINLGAAYAAQGRTAQAEAMFKAAILSDRQYELELADGRWVDSRAAARMALAELKRSDRLATR